MKEYLKKEIKSILIGILAYIIFYSANELYGALLMKTGIIKVDLAGNSSSWHPLLIISNILAILTLIAPGMLAGWFTNASGIVTATIVVLFCYIVSFLVFSMGLKIWNLDFFTLFVLLQSLIQPVAIGAVSGAAGQHLKNEGLGL
jgi:cobalamin biosynthesis protein CobD/CbiB